MTTRALIVEDEPLARRTLRDFLGEADWLELVGEAADGARAVELIDRYTPDLVFLDVEMPELDGLEVLERIEHRPAVVFTTAYDEYAVAAFELEAIDYLVKPFGRKRFHATLERVRARLEDEAERESEVERARAALADGPLERIFARKGSRIVPIPVGSVVRVEGCDDYSAVHARGERFLVPLRLHDLERRLDPATFVRVHRSHLVNLDQVVEMRVEGRQMAVVMADGSEVVASRSGTARLKELMG